MAIIAFFGGACMEAFTGRSIQGQIAFGRLRFLVRPKPELNRYSSISPEEEMERVCQARAMADATLTDYYERALEDLGEEIANIFSMHRLLLEDEGFSESIATQLRDNHFTAEYAVRVSGHELVEYFRSLKDPYMQARAADIRDITRQMIRFLLRVPPVDPFQGEPAILVADEILPSEVMGLNRRKLLGLVSLNGSVDSHSAMLMDAYHIPAMAKVDLSLTWDGHLALLDGFDGRLYMDPSSALTETLRLRYEAGGRPVNVVEDPDPM